MSVVKRRRELQKAAREVCPAATVETTSGTQLRIIMTGPLGVRKIHCAMTPSDHRDAKNIKREIYRAAREVGTLPQRDGPTATNDNKSHQQ